MLHLDVPEYIRTLVPYVPGKPIEETQRELGLKRVIKLASNENPLGPSPKAVEGMKRALKELHRYPDAAAFRLKGALAAHLKVQSQQIIVGNGSNEIIDFLIRAFCVPGDSIATSQGAFIAYKLCAQVHGVNTVESELTGDLRFNLVALAAKIKRDSRIKMVFVANPNNPTGTYVNKEELLAFLREVATIRGGSVLVVLDYAYWEYVTAKDLPDAIPLLKDYPGLVVLRTFSKVYGLAGTRVGYAVASSELVAILEKIRQPFNLNSLGLVGAEAALKDKAFVTKARTLNRDGLKFWEKALDALDVRYWKSQGNFILANLAPFTGSDVYAACLKQGVIFRPVANYGLKFALRISVGTPAENKIGAKALEKCVKEMRK